MVPEKWLVGDKTSSGGYGTTNDIAILWPPRCKPIVLAIYFTQNKQKAIPSNTVITETTQLVLHKFAQYDRCIQSDF